MIFGIFLHFFRTLRSFSAGEEYFSADAFDLCAFVLCDAVFIRRGKMAAAVGKSGRTRKTEEAGAAASSV